MEEKKDFDIMSWSECENNFIRKVEVDNERVQSVKNKALQRLRRAESTNVDLENVSFVVEDYYEVIKELLVAYLLKNGLRSKNHQCLISYFFKENKNYEKEAYIIQQMSFFRNRLNYYGEDIPMNFYSTNKDDFDKIIKLILSLLEKNKQEDLKNSNSPKTGKVIQKTLKRYNKRGDK